MNSWIVLGVGASLSVFGLLLMRWHIREWRQERNDSTLDPQDLLHYHARYRRRMQTSGMLVLLGVLIPVMDWLIEQQARQPQQQQWVIAATLVGFLVFGLIGWVFLLAFGDMLSTRTHSTVALAKVRQKQRELERQLEAFKSRETNGSSSPKGNSYN